MQGRNIDNDFTSHLLDRTQQERCVGIRQRCHALAEVVREWVPEGREQSLALTKLEEAMFWANAGISRIGSTE